MANTAAIRLGASEVCGSSFAVRSLLYRQLAYLRYTKIHRCVFARWLWSPRPT